MNKYLIPLTTVAILFAGALFFPTKVYACSCIQQTITDHYDQADVVFRGFAMEPNQVDVDLDNQLQDTKAVFAVDTWYKGDPIGSTVDVFTTGSSAACGVSFSKGVEYIVFGNFDEQGVTTNLCAGSFAVTMESTSDVAQVIELADQVPPTLPEVEELELPITAELVDQVQYNMQALIILSIVNTALLALMAIAIVSFFLFRPRPPQSNSTEDQITENSVQDILDDLTRETE